MRRWLLLLVMAILPLQSTWAAVAAYCQHEREPAAAAHFGHHAHEHEAPAAASDDDGPQPPFAAHADCADCQLAHAQPLPSRVATVPGGALPPRIAAEPALHPSHVEDTPERPDRRAA